MLEQHKLPLTVAAAVLAIVGIAVWLARQPPSLPVRIPTAAPASRTLKVHVAGAVESPGLYELAAGARVQDALDAAGGPLPGGDVDRLNLAMRLRDGQQVFVPSERLAAREDAPNGIGRVNLNRADQASLEELPGVGPATARKILQHREEHGPFQSADDLRTARLVSGATWERLKDIVVAP